MKIISHFNDYYDYYPSCSRNDTLIYNRNYVMAQLPKRSIRDCTGSIYVLVGDKAIVLTYYPVYRLDLAFDGTNNSLQRKERDGLIWDSVGKRFTTKLGSGCEAKYASNITHKVGAGNITKDGVIGVSTSITNDLLTHGKVEPACHTRARTGLEAPIAVFDTSGNGVAYLDINVSGSGLQDVLECHIDNVASTIDMYVSSQHNDKSHEMDNDNKIKSAGFDSNSFKHRK